MRQWRSLHLPGLIPDWLPPGVRGLNTYVLEPIDEVLHLLGEALRIVSLALVLLEDPLVAAINLVLAELQDLIDSFVALYGVHVLFMPAISGTPATILSNMLELAPEGGSTGTRAWYDAFTSSVYDDGDIHRPDYPDDHYVVSATLMFGVKGLGNLLRLLTLLRRLFGRLTPYSFDDDALPVPQNLRLRGLTANASRTDGTTAEDVVWIAGQDAAGGLTAYLKWDAPSTISEAIRLFKGATARVVATRLYIRSDRPFEVTDADEELSAHEVWSTTSPAFDDFKLVRVDPETVYYAAVGFDAEVQVEGGTPEEVEILSHYAASNSVTLRAPVKSARRRTGPTGTPPDWVSLQSSLDIFPGLREAVTALRDLVEDMKQDLVTSSFDDLQEAIALIQEYATFYRKRVQAIEAFVDQFSRVLEALNHFDLYLYLFGGVGGTELLVGEMQEALFAPDTQNKPPFDSVDDYVASVTLVAAAREPAPVQATINVLQALFGYTPSDTSLLDLARQAATSVAPNSTADGEDPAPVAGAPTTQALIDAAAAMIDEEADAVLRELSERQLAGTPA